jgi:diguanylate cyclase (GGDEF)-like protein
MPEQQGSMLTVYFSLSCLFAILGMLPWQPSETMRIEKRTVVLARTYLLTQSLWFVIIFLNMSFSGRLWATISDALIFFSYSVTIYTFHSLAGVNAPRRSWAMVGLALFIAIPVTVMTPGYANKLHMGNLAALILLAENALAIRTFASKRNDVAARTLMLMAFFFVAMFCLRSVFLYIDPSWARWNESYISFLMPLMALAVTFMVLASMAMTAQDQLLHLALRDKLTGLRNRHAVMQDYKSFASSADRHRKAFALVVCDLDFFKSVNDRFGHASGDLVLVRFAGTLQSILRDSDVAARVGGEEFVMLISETEQESLDKLCQRLLDTTRTIDFSDIDPACQLTTSIGATLVDNPGTTFDDAFQQADLRLYAAKRDGRDRAVTH